MQKLNFGCGGRLSPHWTNIDFHSSDSRVQRVNLLAGFPFPDGTFDAVYSSHVLEHFTRSQAAFLLKEAFRVLKPGGIVRTVVPDLEGSCREYLRILDLPDESPEKAENYEWAVIELLDQMVRNEPGGEMRKYLYKVRASQDPKRIAHAQSRFQNTPFGPPGTESLLQRLRRITPEKLATKCHYWYLKAISKLIPSSIRSMVFIETEIGERHQWMYDKFGLARLHRELGFVQCAAKRFDESDIPDFLSDALDNNPDGTSYKNNSIYMEARKPTV